MKNEIICCVKTFERPEAAKRLIASIRAFYPDIRIRVADDSRVPGINFTDSAVGCLSYDNLPYDTGLSAGRNHLIDRVETPYVLILDDDFVFVEQTRIERFIPLLAHGVFDILGGLMLSSGSPNPHAAWMEQKGDTLYYEHVTRCEGPVRCDLVMNFICAKTEVLQRVRWDDELKLGEHLDFYMRAQEAEARVGFLPSVAIDHRPVRSKEYNGMRHEKARHYRQLFQEKRGIRHIVGSARWSAGGRA